MKNFLLLNFGGIGDEILFLPTLISLKKAYPNSKITLALEPRSKNITDLTDTIDDIILVDIKTKNKYLELIKFILNVRFKKFDTIISAGSNKFISLILLLTGIKERYGYDTGILSQKFLTKAIPLNKNQYASKMYHDLISELSDIKTEIPEIKIEQKEKIPNSILIHHGVSKLSVEKGMIKTIPAKTWAQVIDLLSELGKNVILAGGPDDKECIERIRNLTVHKNFNDLYGKTKSLYELAQLISSAEIFLCSDSAPLHIAVALKTKTFAIFGSTDDKKLIPDNGFVIPVKANDNCPVKPCLWEHRQTTCKELFCLRISAQDIIKKIFQV